MTPADIKAMADIVTNAYRAIEHGAWNGNRYVKPDGETWSESQMWIEASKHIPKEWREIIRVLAQGGDYYSIQW